MLYDTDMQNMIGAITPSDEKLVSKGIQSVRQHITLLKDYISLDIEQFKAFVKNELCDEEIILDDNDANEISKIEKEYLTNDFIYGNNPHYNILRKGRIEGVGEMVVSMEMKNDTIKKINIQGDFFLLGDIDSTLIKPLIGKKLQSEVLNEALPDKLYEIILNLKKEDFISLLTKQ